MTDDHPTVSKRPLRDFLARNPYPRPMTDGLFFRDKMRAIHRIAPDRIGPRLLEIGGGQSGLSKMLYPEAHVTNADLDPAFAEAPCNKQPGVEFRAADATDLPFEDASFDAVTMFDLLEHVPDDDAVAREALRVVRPGGVILVTTPDADRWRYPYYGFLRGICPPEEELFGLWGHVRRGYDQSRLDELFDGPAYRAGSFINPLLAISHDVSFSRLGRRGRLALHALAAPASVAGWLSSGAPGRGTEIAAAWKREASA